jgi:hypothetical protein
VQGEVALPEKVDLRWHILHEMLFFQVMTHAGKERERKRKSPETAS